MLSESATGKNTFKTSTGNHGKIVPLPKVDASE